MIETSSPQLPSLNLWQAQVLRFTVFSSTPIGDELNQWWELAASTPPDNCSTQPKKALHEHSGMIDDNALLTLKVEMQRIDWYYAARVDPDDDDARIPSISPLPIAIERFRSMMEKWANACPEALRVAFGGIFAMPANSKESSYEILNRYLHFVQLDSDALEFTFRINRRRPSKTVSGVAINRLSTWSTLRTVAILGEVAIESGATDFSQLSENFACRLEVDINTVPRPDQRIGPEQISSVFGELIELGQEIAARGDVK